MAAALLQLEINQKEKSSKVKDVDIGDQQMNGDKPEDASNERDPETRDTQIEISSTEYDDDNSNAESMSG